VEDRAGVVVPPNPAERDRPRMDPPNVLWFFGAYALVFAAYALLKTIPKSNSSLWVFVTSLAFLAGFAVASWLLLQRLWWVPGGLASALAVAMVPAVSIGFLKLVHVWPKHLGDPFNHFSGYAFGVALVAAAAGVVAFALTRFPFNFFVVVAALLVASQLLAAAFESSPAADDRATMALVAGAALVIIGVFFDAFGRRSDAFWFHVLGWFSVAGGLVFFTVDPEGDPNRGWVPMLIVGVLMLMVAGPIRRATWAAYGVLGYYAPVLHFMIKGLNEDRWPFALLLLAVALTIFALGMLLHRYGAVWSQRFVRRPPPAPPPLP
jgi:hypothetical protein